MTTARNSGDIDLENLRERLRKMSDRELREFGKATRRACDKESQLGPQSSRFLELQLNEAKLEFERRKKTRREQYLQSLRNKMG
jgi:hypothetical protein